MPEQTDIWERISESPHVIFEEHRWFRFHCDEENTPMSTVKPWSYCPFCGAELLMRSADCQEARNE